MKRPRSLAPTESAEESLKENADSPSLCHKNASTRNSSYPTASIHPAHQAVDRDHIQRQQNNSQSHFGFHSSTTASRFSTSGVWHLNKLTWPSLMAPQASIMRCGWKAVAVMGALRVAPIGARFRKDM